MIKLTYMENYEKFLKSIDGDLAKIFENQKEYICCKEGCSLCCERGDYPISALEYNYMMIGYDKLDSEIKSKIKENTNTLIKENKESMYVCPFLIEKRCSIYENRPIVCRAFGVLTEDAKGNPTFPFCATLGLNYSQIYDKEKNHLSSELVEKNNMKVFPRIFRLSNKVVMNLPLAKQLNIDFGEFDTMINFLKNKGLK